jgi:hypothetical protein
MSDEPFYSPKATPAPARVAKPGELLFEFVRASDHALIACELRFHGESFGWEAQCFIRGEFFVSHGAFVTKAQAVRWGRKNARRSREADDLARRA